MTVNTMNWTVAAILASLLLASVGVVGQGQPPEVSLAGGIDADVACATWTNPPTHDDRCVPVVVQFDDEELVVDATATGATSYYWYWDYVLDGRTGSPLAGPEGSAEDPATIPAGQLDAANGWYTYFLSYCATDASGAFCESADPCTSTTDTTCDYLEVRILPAALRPVVSITGPAALPDQSADDLGHPFILSGACSNCEAPIAGNDDPVFRWKQDGVEASESADLAVGLAGKQHGDQVTVALQAFSYPREDIFPDLQLNTTEAVTKTLDLRPVFTVDLETGDVGDTLEPSIVLAYPASDDDVSYGYSWTLDGDQVGTGETLTLTEGDFAQGDTVVLTVTLTNTAAGGSVSRSVSKSVTLVDTTPPVVTITPDRSPDSGDWYTSPVTFTATATDAASEVESCDSDVVYGSGDGQDRTVTMECTDAAGNTGSATHTFDYDGTTPSVSVTVPKWANGDKVTFTVTDATSGVSSWSAQYRIDGGSWTDLGGSGDERDLPTTTDGAVVDFRVEATDNAGNVRAYPSSPAATTTVDTSPPAAPGGFDATAQAGGSFILSWNAAAVDGAPVKEYKLQHRLAGGTYATLATVGERTYTASLDAADGTTHEFRVAAVDEDGKEGPYTDATDAVAHNRLPEGTLTVTSPTHGDGASKDAEVEFSWSGLTAGPGETIVYRYALSEESDLELTSSAETTTDTSIQFDDVAPGTWYFHLAGAGTVGVVEAEALEVEVLPLASQEEITEANTKVVVKVTREGATNVVTWVLPEDTPADVEGVQVLRSNSPYRVVATIPADSDGFEDGTFVDDTDGADAGSKYLVTMYYGESALLGKQPEGEDLVLPEPLMDGAVAPASEGSLFGHAAFYLGLVAMLAIVGFAISAVVTHGRQRPAVAQGHERTSWEATA